MSENNSGSDHIEHNASNSRPAEATSAALPDDVVALVKMAQKTPLLSVDEEKDLGCRMAKGDEEAHRKMVEANLRLAITMALKQFKQGDTHGLTLADLIQEAHSAVMWATRRFNPNMGSRFSFFASGCIRARMKRALWEAQLKSTEQEKENS